MHELRARALGLTGPAVEESPALRASSPSSARATPPPTPHPRRRWLTVALAGERLASFASLLWARPFRDSPPTRTAAPRAPPITQKGDFYSRAVRGDLRNFGLEKFRSGDRSAGGDGVLSPKDTRSHTPRLPPPATREPVEDQNNTTMNSQTQRARVLCRAQTRTLPKGAGLLNLA